MIGIQKAAYFIPNTKIKLSDNKEKYNIDIPKAKVFEKLYGFYFIPQAENMSMVELVKIPVAKILMDPLLNVNDIKYIIHAHSNKILTIMGKSVIREVKNELKINNAISFGTSLNNCASVLSGLTIVNMLLQNEHQSAKAIIVTGEISYTYCFQQIPDVTFMGDASAAILLGKDYPDDQFLYLETEVLGEYANCLWLTPEETSSFRDIYPVKLANVIARAVEHARLSLDDITLIIPHNVNIISWRNAARALSFPFSKIYLNNMNNNAHCFGSDVIINYADAVDHGLLNKGDYYVMVSVGLGCTFSAAVFKH